MKIDHFYWWSEIKQNAGSSPRIKYKKIGMHFYPLFKEKKLPIYKKYINDSYVNLIAHIMIKRSFFISVNP
jgi:hypothetical protein